MTDRVRLSSLFGAARAETPPTVEVADSVMRTLGEGVGPRAAGVPRPLLWISVASSAAAAGLAAAVLLTWPRDGSAVNQILQVVNWAAQ